MAHCPRERRREQHEHRVREPVGGARHPGPAAQPRAPHRHAAVPRVELPDAHLLGAPRGGRARRGPSAQGVSRALRRVRPAARGARAPRTLAPGDAALLRRHRSDGAARVAALRTAVGARERGLRRVRRDARRVRGPPRRSGEDAARPPLRECRGAGCGAGEGRDLPPRDHPLLRRAVGASGAADLLRRRTESGSDVGRDGRRVSHRVAAVHPVHGGKCPRVRRLREPVGVHHRGARRRGERGGDAVPRRRERAEAAAPRRHRRDGHGRRRDGEGGGGRITSRGASRASATIPGRRAD